MTVGCAPVKICRLCQAEDNGTNFRRLPAICRACENARRRAGNHGLRRFHEGCRCDECLAAKRASDDAYRGRLDREAAAKRAKYQPKHGLGLRYYRAGCRCPICLDRHRQHVARQAQKRLRDSERRREVLAADAERRRRWSRSAVARGRRINEFSQPTARRRGSPWTGPELELILTREDLTDPELAAMLGRTVYGVRGARCRALKDPRFATLAGVPRTVQM